MAANLNKNTSVKKLTESEVLIGLEKGTIQINDFNIEDDKVIVDFYSTHYDEELDDVFMSINSEIIIEKLGEYEEEVILYKDNFISIKNKSSWVDKNGNLEEDGDEEIIHRSLVNEVIYDHFISKPISVEYELKIQTSIGLSLNKYGISAEQWHQKSEDEKKKFVIDIYNNEIGITPIDLKQIV